MGPVLRVEDAEQPLRDAVVVVGVDGIVRAGLGNYSEMKMVVPVLGNTGSIGPPELLLLPLLERHEAAVHAQFMPRNSLSRQQKYVRCCAKSERHVLTTCTQ